MEEDIKTGRIRSIYDPIEAMPTIDMLVDIMVASQRTYGEPVDPNGARRFVRGLVALGVIHISGDGPSAT